jgi:hypothetical protein
MGEVVLMRFTGRRSTAQVGARRTFSPHIGYAYTLEYRGTPKGVADLERWYNFRGISTVASSGMGSAWNSLTATIGTSQVDGQDVPIDEWDIESDFVPEDIYGAPALSLNIGLLTNTKQNDIYGTIAEAMRETVTKGDEAIIDLCAKYPSCALEIAALYNLKRQKIDSFEIQRPVLTRSRTMSRVWWKTYGEKMPMARIEPFYSSEQMRSTFAIPDDIFSKFPTPEAPTKQDFAWGWKRSRNRTHIIPVLDKVQHDTAWIFAAWSKSLYYLVE